MGPLELNKLVEWDGFDTQQTPPNSDESLIITTLSPLLTVNDNGHPDVRFPHQELADALKVNASALKLSASYTRTEMVGGYHTHLRLPRQQWPAIAAGSVFVFELGADVIEEYQARFTQLEHDGLGLRKGEGYGRIAVNRHGHLGLETEQCLDDPDNANAPNSTCIRGTARSLRTSAGCSTDTLYGRNARNRTNCCQSDRECSKQFSSRATTAISPTNSCCRC